MSHAAPAVALLFDDVELGEQLRLALNERGARIVHEGAISTLTRELLQSVGAQVLFVNLDDSADDALDHLYEVIDGDTPRVVFNDAEASRTLTGWDRARWARHLAVKVLEMGDIDPPRPEDAQVVEITPAPTFDASPTDGSSFDESGVRPSEHDPSSEPVANSEAAKSEAEEEIEPEVDCVRAFDAERGASFEAPFDKTTEAKQHSAVMEPPSFTADEPSHANTEKLHGQAASEESENLAAELEALLASGELSVEEEEAPIGSGLRFTGDEDLPPLHDGHFGSPADEALDARVSEPLEIGHSATDVGAEAGSINSTPPVFRLDHLELAPMNDALLATIPTASAEQTPVDGAAAKARVPDGWALLDEDAAPASSAQASAEKIGAADFDIHKISATDFLAPEADSAEPDDELLMSLQLVPMEEAILPKPFEDPEEVRANSLGQVVLLGAAASSIDSVCRFFAALSVKTSLAFVHTQHLGETSIDALVEILAAHSALPVRVAGKASKARVGEILVVPAGQQLRLVRDGSVELVPVGIHASQGPSIDASFSMAANVFGRDTLAIVFSGRGNDAVAGARAVHDRGGKVWVESVTGEPYADMVNDISAERLVSFSGRPHELAAHLIEVFP